jgi:tRNA(Leu) C34 or U34 (ribose-2'-O)-methylase TrmL
VSASVLLLGPAYAHNVGNALRACAVLGARELLWTGDRVPAPEDWPTGARLPREERMALYRHVEITHHGSWSKVLGERILRGGVVPVAVEKRAQAERLPDFEHPEHALYVFGPEDDSLDRGVLSACHRFVRIPTVDGMENVPLNLAAAVNVVLYDRLAKKTDERWDEHRRVMRERALADEELDWINANPRAAQRKYGARGVL